MMTMLRCLGVMSRLDGRLTLTSVLLVLVFFPFFSGELLVCILCPFIYTIMCIILMFLLLCTCT